MQPSSTGAAASAPSTVIQPPVLLGSRWAFALGMALLTLLAVVVGARWWDDPQRSGAERVVQQPVVNAPSSPRQELPSAPDPGDNP